MAVSKPTARRYKRKLRRNLEGLLSKCYKYGELKGVELALYIEYAEKGEFVSYESDGFSSHSKIIEKVSKNTDHHLQHMLTDLEQKLNSKSRNYTPRDVKSKLHLETPDVEPGGVIKKQAGTAGRTKMKSVRELGSDEFPEFPEFQLSILQRGRGWVNQ